MNRFRLLAVEAIRDAVRRRIVAAIAVLSLLSLMILDTCTGCSTAEVTVNGEPRQLAELAGATGIATMVTLGQWIIVLAGVLGADHLAQTLDDGTANLCLARPVGRSAFAFARLAGALTIAFATGALLLGATAGLLAARGSLSVAPALWAAAACLVSCVVVGSLAMALSLRLPRMATILVVLAAVATVAIANTAGAASAELGGALGLIDRLGPPMAGSMALALGPWIEQVEIAGNPVVVGLRLLVWACLGLGALALAFRRAELGR